MVIIFLISCKVTHFICNSRILRVRLVYNTVRCFYKAILIDSCIRSK